MNLYREKASLKAQIIDTERMLKLVGNHPIMSVGLLERLENLNLRLNNLPEELLEPAISLLFSGDAVRGSTGIKSSFLSKMIAPFQELIKTQSAIVRFGDVGKRGQAKRSPFTELFITSLPVGSFGVELRKLDSQDLFAEMDVAIAMKQVMQLVENSAKSDEAFENTIKEIPKRSLSNLKKFLKEVSDENSFLKMESGEYAIEVSEKNIKEAYERVSETIDEEQEIIITGILRGILLDSGRFEVQDIEGKKISGFISQELSEDELVNYDQQYLNNQCTIHLKSFKTIFKTGNESTDYELLSID